MPAYNHTWFFLGLRLQSHKCYKITQANKGNDMYSSANADAADLQT